MKLKSLLALGISFLSLTAPAQPEGRVFFRETTRVDRVAPPIGSLSLTPLQGLLLGGRVTSLPAPYSGPAGILVASDGLVQVCDAQDCSGAPSFQPAGPVRSGQFVRVSRPGPIAPGQNVGVTLSLPGGSTASFRASARPQAASFGSFTTVASLPSIDAESNLSRFAGWVEAPIAITSGEYRICAQNGDCGSYTTASGTISDGDEVQVRLPAGTFGQSAQSSVTAAGISRSFTVQASIPAVTDPAAFAFAPALGQTPGATIDSAPALLAGHDLTTVRLSADTHPSTSYRLCTSIDCTDGTFTRTVTENVPSGRYLQMRMIAGAFGETVMGKVEAGTRSAAFDVTSRTRNITPDPFFLTNIDGAEPNTTAVSESVRLVGHEGIRVNVGGTPNLDAAYQICTTADCNDAVWKTGPTENVPSGAYIRLRMRPVSFGTHYLYVSAGDSSSTWSVTTRVRDTTPDAFVFDAFKDIGPGTTVTSNETKLTGFDDAPISVTGGTYSLNWGAFTAAPGTAKAGDTVTLRLTAGAFGEARTATLDVGGVTAGFTATVRAKNVTPNAFSFAALTGRDVGTDAISAPALLSGHDGIDVSLASGSHASAGYQICVASDCSDQASATWATGSTANVSAGRYVRVKIRPNTFSATASATLIAGTRQAVFSVTSSAKDVVPDAFSFPSVANAEPGEEVESDAVLVTGHQGITVALAAGTPSGTLYRICAVAECGDDVEPTWLSAPTVNVPAGRYIQLAMTPALTSFGSATGITLEAGASQVTWNVTTRAKDITPDAFAFENRFDVDPSIDVVSEPVRLEGFDNADVSLGGDSHASAGYQICSTETCSDQGVSFWATGITPSVAEGTYVRMKLRLADYSETASARLVVGQTSGIFTTTARDFNGDPVSIANFDAKNDVQAGNEQTSVARYLTGFDDTIEVTVSGFDAAYRTCKVVNCSDRAQEPGAGWTRTPSDVEAGTFVQLRMTAGDNDATRVASLGYGGRTATWSVKTRSGILYAFTSHTFTPCGAAGQTGPALAACQSSYSSAAWRTNNAWFKVTAGVQQWTVPATGTYRIRAAGSVGGMGRAGTIAGGTGLIVTRDVALTEGTVLQIVVGQRPNNTTSTARAGGGGGGSFVYTGGTAGSGLLLAAGGGGGAAATATTGYPGCPAPSSMLPTNGATTTGTCATKTNNGSGGNAGGYVGTSTASYMGGGGGAGWLSAGGRASSGGYGGTQWTGGQWGLSNSAFGGFGGGGGSRYGGGGGGGYTGGTGGDYVTSSPTYRGRGGAGGSFGGTYAGTNSGVGSVLITKL